MIFMHAANAGLLLLAFSASVWAELPYFAKPITLGAHRGGRDLWPENTLLAYQKAAERWPDAVLEGDVTLSSDGEVVMMHDGTVDRTTDGTGSIHTKTLAELKQLDAGYRFTPDGGKTFPYRGQGVTVPKLAEAIAALPNFRFLIELKPGVDMTEKVVNVIREANAFDRVILASFVPGAMDYARQIDPHTLTCFDLTTGMDLVAALHGGDWEAYQPKDALLAIDRDMMRYYEVVPEDFVKLRAKDIRVQLHTINSRDEMRELLDMGIDGILTDCPDVLAEVIAERAAK
ncbi:MAG: glycerophosphoryl diester phosphodiesterase [Candidatus Hydrogenedentes bacterium]|nr:glycerophosphoryl diester phosphodiesterase [Candidatus Hydrogenedentota bacterium]